MATRSRRLQGTSRFQDSGDTRQIVRRARPRRHGIQMRHQQNRFAVTGNRLGDNVAHRCAGHGAGPVVAGLAADDTRRHAQARQLSHRPRMHRRIFSTAGGMGTLRSQQAGQHRPGAGGGKFRRRSIWPARRLGLQTAQNPCRYAQQSQQPDAQHATHGTPSRGQRLARGRNRVNRAPLFPKERPPRARVICPGRRP